jgi:hypothetical protein
MVYQACFDEVDGRLTSIFWMSPKQKQLWLRYHDVVVNDLTYKKNRYDLILFVLIVIIIPDYCSCMCLSG